MLIPASKISSLSQGMFVGAVSDDFSQKIEQKFFHAQILVDSEKVKQQEMSYKKIPTLTSFTDYKGNDYLDRAITDNYNQIKKDVNQLIKNEIKRIENDANLVHLLNNDN
jgi:putative methionine-R-sulfoxide reductase with GAF domain